MSASLAATHSVPATRAQWQVEPLSQRTLGARLEAWNTLWNTLPLRHPMLHGSFVEALLRHWGTGKEWLCTLGDPAQPQGMCIVRPSGWGLWSAFLPMQSQVGVVLLRDLDDANGLLPSLPGMALQLDLLAVDPDVLPADFAVHCGLEVMPHTYTLGIQLTGNFDEWWHSRTKKLRDNVKRYQAELAACFNHIEFRWIDTLPELAAALARYAHLEGQGWKAHGGTAVTPGSAQLAFYADLSEHDDTASAPSGRMVISELWGDGQLLASRVLWVSPEGDLAALKTTHSEPHKRVSPGRILLHLTLREAHQRWAGKRLELCTDATADLATWADRPRHTRHLSLYRSTAVRSLRLAVQLATRTVLAAAPAGTADRLGSPLATSVFRRLQDLPASAQRLLTKAEADSLQLGADWLQTLESKVFAPATGEQHPAMEPMYAVLSQGGEALAVWPLLVRKRAPEQLESLANYYCAITGPVLQPWCKPLQLAVLVQHLAATVPQAHSLRLQPLDPNSHATQTVRIALRMSGYGVFGFFAFHNWVWRGQSNWARYFADRSSNLRSNVRRSTKRMADAGGRIEIIKKPSDVARGMAAYEAVYGRSWKTAEPFPAFFRELAAATAQRGYLRLGVAWLGERPIAAQFWTVAQGKAEIHKLAYDEEYQIIGAGTALSAAMFEEVINIDHVHTIDYLIGDDAYKSNWMNVRGQRWGLIAGKAYSFRGGLLLFTEALRRVGRWLRSNSGRQSIPDAHKATAS